MAVQRTRRRIVGVDPRRMRGSPSSTETQYGAFQQLAGEALPWWFGSTLTLLMYPAAVCVVGVYRNAPSNKSPSRFR